MIISADPLRAVERVRIFRLSFRRKPRLGKNKRTHSFLTFLALGQGIWKLGRGICKLGQGTWELGRGIWTLSREIQGLSRGIQTIPPPGPENPGIPSPRPENLGISPRLSLYPNRPKGDPKTIAIYIRINPFTFESIHLRSNQSKA